MVINYANVNVKMSYKKLSSGGIIMYVSRSVNLFLRIIGIFYYKMRIYLNASIFKLRQQIPLRPNSFVGMIIEISK